MADLKDLKGALVFAMKFEAAQQATRKDRHPIRAVNESDTSNSKKADGRRPLNAGPAVEKGICREAAGHAKALKLISAFQKEVTEIIVPGYIGNDVSFNSGLIGSGQENKANGLLIAFDASGPSRKTIPVRICNVTEKPRVFQKGEVLATCSPVTCVCKSSSLLLSNSPQQLTPDLLENAELSPEQKSSAERLFQEFEDVFSRNSSDIGH
ncbi:retroviral aspartyl protease family protein [Trichonephila clavipes]|nr:retroviral aspartyl protease family protein [Trichonephila clavipes]